MLIPWSEPASTAKPKSAPPLSMRAMGLSVSDAIRLLMLRIADEKRLPFAVQVPNATTAKALDELEAGKGKRFDSADALFEDLGI